MVATFPELFRLLTSDLGRAVLFALGQGSASAEDLCNILRCRLDAVQQDLERLERGGLVVANHKSHPCMYLLAPDVQVNLSHGGGGELAVKVGTNGKFTLKMEDITSE